MADGRIGASEGETRPDDPALDGLDTRKLVIQIPCHNDEETLPIPLRELPDRFLGFEVVEILATDDGRQNSTVRMALEHGVDHVVVSSWSRGLAHAFTLGLQPSVASGADVIVNTDGTTSIGRNTFRDSCVRSATARWTWWSTSVRSRGWITSRMSRSSSSDSEAGWPAT